MWNNSLIRPALIRFYEALDQGQKERFAGSQQLIPNSISLAATAKVGGSSGTILLL
jgi:hypothetical protein